MNTYEDPAVRAAIASTYSVNMDHNPVRKAVGLSVHQGIERLGSRGAVYYEPACGIDAERARFSTHRYRVVDQLLTCPKCIALVNG